MIKELIDSDIGKWIEYVDEHIFPSAWNPCWKLKSFNNEKQTAWIVFKCNLDWDNWKDYTAESCKYNDLNLLHR